MPRTYDRMVCLVGENPLPVYLGIRQLAADGATVVLVHSKETREVAERIRKLVEPRVTTLFPEKLADPFDPVRTGVVMAKLAREYPDACLNYTGGTKVMAAYGLYAWADYARRVVYLDESNRLLRFGDGVDEKLAGSELIMGELCDLHGVEKTVTTFHPDVPLTDLVNILTHAGSLPDLPDVRDLRTWMNENQPIWTGLLGLLSDDGRRALQRCSTGKQYRFFSDDQWTEELVRRLILGLDRATGQISQTGPPANPVVLESELLCAQKFKIKKQEFESDLVMMIDFTLRYISVTTSRRHKYIKGKSFEAIHRSRQIGGDLARSCVVCTSESSTVWQVRNVVNDDRHEVFGIENVHRWIAGDGTTLRDFLTC